MSPSRAAQVPILVLSCDRYSDLWRPFFEVFWRRWPDCPFPVYLGTNHLNFDHPKVKTICVGDDSSWASGVREMVERLGTSHLIVLLEDFLITKPVVSEDVLRLVDLALDNDIASLGFGPLPPPARAATDRVPNVEPPIALVPAGSLYRVSAQAAVWRADALLRYLVPGFTPWEFELLGTLMSEFQSDVFWGAMHPTISYEQAIEKGRWKQEGLKICRDAGYSVDVSTRAAFTEEELESHYHASGLSSGVSEAKSEAMRTFQLGQRVAGLKATMRLLLRRPLAFQLWAIALFGTLGPVPLRWLRRQGLRRRIQDSLRREPGGRRVSAARYI